VTIARAIELKHSSSLISALAFETAQLYTNAGMTLRSTFDFCERLCCQFICTVCLKKTNTLGFWSWLRQM